MIADWNKVIDIEHESIRPSKSRSLTFRKKTNLPILKTQFVILKETRAEVDTCPVCGFREVIDFQQQRLSVPVIPSIFLN